MNNAQWWQNDITSLARTNRKRIDEEGTWNHGQCSLHRCQEAVFMRLDVEPVSQGHDQAEAEVSHRRAGRFHIDTVVFDPFGAPLPPLHLTPCSVAVENDL